MTEADREFDYLMTKARQHGESDALRIAADTIAKLRAEKSVPVIVTVFRGLAEVDQKPAGVRVVVVDLDSDEDHDGAHIVDDAAAESGFGSLHAEVRTVDYDDYYSERPESFGGVCCPFCGAEDEPTQEWWQDGQTWWKCFACRVKFHAIPNAESITIAEVYQ